MKRILAIRLPNWPVQRLVSIRPELRDQAVVLHNAARRGQHVVACSHAARERGVCEGMSVAEVNALVRGGFHLEPHDPLADRQALEKLAGWCHRYSPCAGCEGADRPETLLLDVTGVAPLFGSERALVDQIAKGLQRLGLLVQLALADSIGAAWAVSHYGFPNPFVAETNIVDCGGSREALRPLPLAALRLPVAMVETLGRLGLRQIGEMLLIPRVELQVRFGTLLLEQIDQALGAMTEVIRPVQPSPNFTAKWLLEPPVERRDAIGTVIGRLIGQLTQRLADRGEGALQLQCQLDCRPAAATSFEVGLFRPTADPQRLLELVNMQMERIRLPDPVGAVLIQVTRYARLECRQQEFFDREGSHENDSPEVAALVERLTSRLGRTRVVHCQLQSDAQPEVAYREQPLINRPPRRKRFRPPNG
ncbi:MAG: DNA polymerase Y family protein, partial [Pirellulales bacterium]